MAAPKPRYYGTKDISIILSVSATKALDIMHQFERHGKVLRDGKLIRVAISDFDEWIKQHTANQR